jgi:dihydrofolate reductase
VLTHHAREPIEMEGGTSFHFVTQGFDAAYAQAREVAGEDGIDIAGGASTARQALAAKVIDELTLDLIPVLLGSGERLFDGVESFGLKPVEALHSPLAPTSATAGLGKEPTAGPHTARIEAGKKVRLRVRHH